MMYDVHMWYCTLGPLEIHHCSVTGASPRGMCSVKEAGALDHRKSNLEPSTIQLSCVLSFLYPLI